ncbi:hypothetical protein HDU67_004342 [Dinochytrium kinnereticum]|nr:hypothetical protein HDU67_004342 [Dinochytrium kinnereticum]
MLGMEGSHVVITGASGGVGIPTAMAFLEAGANVTLQYNSNASSLKEVEASYPNNCLRVKASVESENDVSSLFNSAVEKFGPVSTLVVCHGIWPTEDVGVKDMSLERWKNTMSVNLDGTFLFCREYLRQLETAVKAGKELRNVGIVMVGSTAGKFGEAWHSDYSCSKSAMMYGFTLSMKNEIVKVHPRGRVNTVSPGWIRTPMAERAMQDKSLLYQALASSPLKKVSEPSDIANAILFLSSEKMSGNITGISLDVNAGMEGSYFKTFQKMTSAYERDVFSVKATPSVSVEVNFCIDQGLSSLVCPPRNIWVGRTMLETIQRRKILFIYIHGFLGSDESFEAFPEHLMACLSATHNVPRDMMEALVFPRFETKGSNQLKVRLLVDWLLLNATTVKAEKVVLLAHSMGGILASDAYQVLYGVGEMGRSARANAKALREVRAKARLQAKVSSLSWLVGGVKAFGLGVGKLGNSLRSASNSSISSASSAAPATLEKDSNSAGSSMTLEPEASPLSDDTPPVPSESKAEGAADQATEEESILNDDLDIDESMTRLLVNIRGIITFDSPFYGLSPTVITSAGAGKVVSAVASASEYARAAMTAMSNMVATQTLPTPANLASAQAGLPKPSTSMPAGWSFPGGFSAATAASDKLDKPEWMNVEEAGRAEAEAEGATVGGVSARKSNTDGKRGVDSQYAAVDSVGDPPISSESSGQPKPSGTDPKHSTEDVELTDKMALVSVSSKDSKQPTPELTSAVGTSQEWSWTSIALAGAGAAAGLYMASGLIPIAAQVIPAREIIKGAATQWALKQVEEVRSHAEFLYPLINTSAEMHARVKALVEEMEKEKKIHYHGFYLELPPFGTPQSKSSDPSTTPAPEEMEPTLTADALPDDPTKIPDVPLAPQPRNFCVPPPIETEHLFETVTSPLADEIDAHMHMFSAELNQEHYMELVVKTAAEIMKVLESTGPTA